MYLHLLCLRPGCIFFFLLRFVLAEFISFSFHCKITIIDAPVNILFWPCKDKIMTLLYLIRVQRDGEVWKKMPAFTILSCIVFVLLSRWYSIFTILFCCQIIIVIISLCNCFTAWHPSLSVCLHVKILVDFDMFFHLIVSGSLCFREHVGCILNSACACSIFMCL